MFHHFRSAHFFFCSVIFLGSISANAMDLEYAEKVRQRVAVHDPVYVPAMTHLLEDADKAMTDEPWSVTDKKVLAPSKDPKDYVSLAPYFWPDPSKADGMPYLSRDGQVNPETPSGDFSDRNRLEQTFTADRTLKIAGSRTGRLNYAQHSADQ